VTGIAGRFARLLSRWQREAADAPELGLVPEELPEPVTVLVRPPLPAADLAEAGPAFTAAEECRLHVLAEQFAIASPGSRDAGEHLAGWLLAALPDMRGADIAKVLLAVGAALADAAESQVDEYAALRVITDALAGAAPVVAGLELALGQECRW
jgi:GNAT superfamily N-acetyltransferase